MKNQKKSSSFNDMTHVIGVEGGRIPPQAVDLEEATLGAMLIFPEAVEKVAHFLSKDVFYKQANGVIFDAILSLYDRKEPIDLLTVTNRLRETGKLEEVGGPYYVTGLTHPILSDAHIEAHAEIIFDRYIQREIIRVSSEAMGMAFSDEHETDDIFAELERKMSAIGEMIAGKRKSRNLHEILDDCLKEAWQRHENFQKGIENGIRSGFCDLDRITNGWQNSDFIVLAARPSMGKTAVALKFAHTAASSGVPVVLFSLEMKDTQLVHRMILSGLTVNPQNYGSGKTSVEDMQRIEASAGKLYSLPIIIDQSSGVSMSYIRAQSKIHKKNGQCGLIVIDYLQLIREEIRSDRNREQAMSAISNECKCLAKELDVPVIALSQLNRESEKRGGNRPILADLRDSGAIEQDADMVIFVHRPSKYKKDEEFEYQDKYGNVIEDAFQDKKGNVLINYGELFVSKHRNGELGNVKFTHNGSMTEFFDFDRYGYKELKEFKDFRDNRDDRDDRDFREAF